MMLKFLVKSDRAVTVDGLAVFNEGETKEFNNNEVDWYRQSRGVDLVSSLPQGVTLTDIVVVEEDDKKDEEA